MINNIVHIVLLTDDSAFKDYEGVRGSACNRAKKFAQGLQDNVNNSLYAVYERSPGTFVVCRTYDPAKEDLDIPFVETMQISADKLSFVKEVSLLMSA